IAREVLGRGHDRFALFATEVRPLLTPVAATAWTERHSAHVDLLGHLGEPVGRWLLRHADRELARRALLFGLHPAQVVRICRAVLEVVVVQPATLDADLFGELEPTT